MCRREATLRSSFRVHAMSGVTDRRNSPAVALTPPQWHETFSGPPILSSEGTCWAPGLLRRWCDTAPDMEQPALDHHYVTVHLGGAKRVSRRGEGAPILANVELGGVSIVPAGSIFSWRTEGPVDFAHLYIAPRMVDQVILEELDRDPRNVSLIDRVGFTDPLLRSLLCSMLDEIRAPGTASRLFLNTLLRLFTLKLVRDYSTVAGRLSSARHELAPYRLRRVLAFIEAHLAEDISLNNLASLSGNSVYHFSRGFRRATGLPPYRYVLERRIERAKVLLQESFLPLGEVAQQCGFNSQRQFGTMFTKLAGISPGRYRRER